MDFRESISVSGELLDGTRLVVFLDHCNAIDDVGAIAYLPFVSWLNEMYSRKRAILAGLIMTAPGTAMRAASQNFATLCLFGRDPGLCQHDRSGVNWLEVLLNVRCTALLHSPDCLSFLPRDQRTQFGADYKDLRQGSTIFRGIRLRKEQYCQRSKVQFLGRAPRGCMVIRPKLCGYILSLTT